MNSSTVKSFDSKVNGFELIQNKLLKSNYFGKRLLDISSSTILILIFSPILIIVPIIIFLFDEKQVFFIHERIGLNDQPFHIYKFRTMKSTLKIHEFDDYGNLIKNNQAITKIGKFLRKTSIDELPQLFNIFIGDMSLVGPRPLIKVLLDSNTSLSKIRSSVKPGLTGLWQVKNRMNHYNLNDMIEYDLEYIENQSFLLDLKIILVTIPAVISMKGAV